MPQLDTSTFSSQLFWLGVCFLALYFILSYIAIPKITRVLENREEILEGKINEASTYREQAEGLLAEFEAILANARVTAHDQYQAASRATLAEIAQKKRDLLERLNDKLHLAEQEIYRARLKATKEIKVVAIDVAGVILKKLTGNTYSPKELAPKRKKT